MAHMSENTTIEWCDHTINFWHGCTKVSPGCANCYAEGLSRRFGKDIWGHGKAREDHRKGAEKLAVKLNRQAEKKGVRYRVFCNSMSDWLDDEVPVEWLADMLDMIRTTPNLDWLLLTKRPENWRGRIMDVEAATSNRDLAAWLGLWRFSRNPGAPPPPANVWIGTTVEDQKRADERIQTLLDIPAEILFLSVEPLLGPVTLSAYMGKCIGLGDEVETYNFGIDWVIIGGESGPKSRPCELNWIGDLVAECRDGMAACFVKQLGSNWIGDRVFPVPRVTDAKGGDINEWPEEFRVREFPVQNTQTDGPSPRD